MSEIAEFVQRGAAKVNRKTIKGLLEHVTMLKLEFTQLEDEKFPHLVDQLEFLVDVIEDYAEDKLDEIPLVAVAGAAFAIIYAHEQTDLIPDFIPEIGHADDSAVVRAVLIEHEYHFLRYANTRGLDWSKITLKS
ncbi:MAG: DUF1232 domain-containing protein [Verrucomicrobiota bacterium]